MRPRVGQREPMRPQPRRRLSRVEFARLLLAQEGRCARCRENLQPHLIVDEHLTPLDFLGSNDLDNRALFCTDCARAKTESEMAEILHGRRVRGEIGQQCRRRARARKPWTQPRTFLTNRDGPLKRRMDGRVVQRRPRRQFRSIKVT
jgi:hypothetical protein